MKILPKCLTGGAKGGGQLQDETGDECGGFVEVVAVATGIPSASSTLLCGYTVKIL